MRSLLVITMTLAIAMPAVADVPIYEKPVGECTMPDGTVVIDPGIIPLPCDTLPICVAWNIGGECVEEEDFQIPGCVAMHGTPEYKAALSAWFEDSIAFNWCCLYDWWAWIADLEF